MQRIRLKTGKRKTSVSRATVRKAVRTVMNNSKKSYE